MCIRDSQTPRNVYIVTIQGSKGTCILSQDRTYYPGIWASFWVPVFTGTCLHYSWTRAVLMGHVHGRQKRRPLTRPVNTGSVYRPQAASFTYPSLSFAHVNSSDLYESQECPLTKMAWPCPVVHSSPTRGDSRALCCYKHVINIVCVRQGCSRVQVSTPVQRLELEFTATNADHTLTTTIQQGTNVYCFHDIERRFSARMRPVVW